MKLKFLSSITLSILLFITESSVAQKSIPDGIYLNNDQLISRTPLPLIELRVKRRTDDVVFVSGCNDYKIIADQDTVPNRFANKDILVFKRNDSLFINCGRYALGYGYALGVTKGTYVAFIAARPPKETETQQVVGQALFGMAGHFVATVFTYDDRLLYVLSTRTGNAKKLTEEYLLARLQEYPTLREKYCAEPVTTSNEVLIRYINLLNKTIAEIN